MLANALFYVALLATLTMTILTAGLAMTRASASRLAQTYLAGGFERAKASLEETLAADIRSGGMPNPLPTFSPLPAQCGDASQICAYRTAETIVLAPRASPGPGSCDASAGNCANDEQANAYVTEDRIAARITVTVVTANGTAIASRSQDVLLRTIGVPPYVIAGGALDGSVDEAGSSGDDGGIAPGAAGACASRGSGAADDTVIRVAYRNASTSACTDGGSWRSSSYTIPRESAAGWSP